MNNMEEMLQENLLSTFKLYPTTIQDTILRVISDRLGRLYSDADQFTDVVLSPGTDRYDIVQAKAAQYNFDIRSEASFSEQVKLLNSIYEIYSKRGSVDSIERMWKYYGGDLPKNVKIEVPAEGIFRYSVSPWSGTHRLQDGNYYRPGVYNISVEGDYDLDALRDFVTKELLTAGTSVNFLKRTILDFDPDGVGLDADEVRERTILDTLSFVSTDRTGLTWSSSSPFFTWSGQPNLFVDITHVREIGNVYIGDIIPYDLFQYTTKTTLGIVHDGPTRRSTLIDTDIFLGYTYEEEKYPLERHLYDNEGNEIVNPSPFPGYFILGHTLLGEVINK